MKEFNNYINESRDLMYSIAFIDVVDDEGLVVPMTLYVDKKYQKQVEKYFADEEGNTFAHVGGGNIEY